MVAVYELDGSGFMNLYRAPEFNFQEAILLVVSCDNQKEADYF